MKMIENIQKFTAEKGKGKKIGLKFIIMITFVLTSFQRIKKSLFSIK